MDHIGREHVDDEFLINLNKEFSFLYDLLVNAKARIEALKNQVETLYVECREVVDLMDIYTIDEPKHWRTNEEVIKDLKKFLKLKLKAPES